MQDRAARNQLLLSNFHFPRYEAWPHQRQSPPKYPPQDQTKHKSFWGLIKYLQHFIQGLADKTAFLWGQLAKLDRNPLVNAAFQWLKSWICNTLLKTTFSYYDRTQPVIVQNNASEYSLGAAVLQTGCPIAFASKILTDVETHYTNIEHDCLSVGLSLEKFLTYTYGRSITVKNDHQSLEMIQHKPIHSTIPVYSTCYSRCRNMILSWKISWAKTWFLLTE